MLFSLLVIFIFAFANHVIYINTLVLTSQTLFSWLPSANMQTSLGLGARQIHDIDSVAFENIFLAKNLYLWGNRLTQIKRSYFNESLFLLQSLDMSFNQINSIEAKSFDTTSMRSSLKHLYLNNNALTHLNSDIFFGLTRLEHLHLNKNILNSLDRITFMGLSMIRYIYMQNNPIGFILPDYVKRLCSTHTYCFIIV